jgi:hypothetical protein
MLINKNYSNRLYAKETQELKSMKKYNKIEGID